MERIDNILQRIQELYYGKREKTAIDIDLMLDYTRVMYADLLELRKRFKDAPGLTEIMPRKAEQPALAAKQEGKEAEQQEPAAAATSEPEKQEEPTNEPTAKTVAPEPEEPVAAATSEPEKQEEPTNEPTAKAVAPGPEGTEAAVASEPEKQEEPTREPTAKAVAPEPEDTVAGSEKAAAEAEVVQEVLHNNSSAISFEPPASQPPHTAQIEDVLMEEEPVTNTPVEDIVLPEIETLPQEPLIPKGNPAATGKTTALKKDIRTSIGINDKYLFLNELFANNKTDYEEALDQLRLLDSYDQAHTWLQAHPARKNGWEEGDDTVQSFLSLVSQYFSSK